MNNINYLFVLLTAVLLFTSCKEDNFIDSIEDGPNLAAFAENSQTVSKISDGSEYKIAVPIKVEGPSLKNVSGDVKVTIEPDYSGIPDSVDKAEAGTNFSLDTNAITLKESDNYLGEFTFTMLTDGITAPKSPKFNLKVTKTSGGGNVTNSGKPIEMTLNYACDSNLQGTYNVKFVDGSGNIISYDRKDGDGNVIEHFDEVTYEDQKITKVGVSDYKTDVIGIFEVGASPYRPSNDIGEGLKFSDSCGEISVPNQTLGIYPNEVTGAGPTVVTPPEAAQNGSLNSFKLKYSLEGFGDYTAVYTKQ